MDAQVFWNVIGRYNAQTIIYQVILFAFLAVAIVLGYTRKNEWICKLMLGLANIFISIMFFGLYAVEPVQKYFALPLYMCIGLLFIFESIKNKNDILQKPNKMQIVLLLLYISYPVVSYSLGNTFPMIATYIMPCPIVSLSIVIYSGYSRKNIVLLVLLTIWGLTGIKSFFFNAYEDIILLSCGIYGVYLVFNECKKRKNVIINKAKRDSKYVEKG